MRITVRPLFFHLQGSGPIRTRDSLSCFISAASKLEKQARYFLIWIRERSPARSRTGRAHFRPLGRRPAGGGRGRDVRRSIVSPQCAPRSRTVTPTLTPRPSATWTARWGQRRQLFRIDISLWFLRSVTFSFRYVRFALRYFQLRYIALRSKTNKHLPTRPDHLRRNTTKKTIAARITVPGFEICERLSIIYLFHYSLIQSFPSPLRHFATPPRPMPRRADNV